MLSLSKHGTQLYRKPPILARPGAQQAAIEDVVTDLSGALQAVGPIRRNRDGVIVGGTAGSVAQPYFASQNARRELFGIAPGDRRLPPGEVAIAGEGELAARTAGAFINHGADRVAVIAVIHAVEHH